MFGAVYGDIIGSYYEIHCTKDYNFELHRESVFTDDSVHRLYTIIDTYVYQLLYLV